MRAPPCSAGPALVMTAEFASNALMPRKSRRSAPLTRTTLHVAPPSIVRNSWPSVHPAQATISLTALRLRQLEEEATVCRTHLASPFVSTGRTPLQAARRTATSSSVTCEDLLKSRAGRGRCAGGQAGKKLRRNAQREKDAAGGPLDAKRRSSAAIRPCSLRLPHTHRPCRRPPRRCRETRPVR